MQPVTRWSCPTQIVIGAGCAQDYVRALDAPFVVADPNLGWSADLVREPDMTDREFIAAITEQRPPGAPVIAVGGGSVLDPVRVAVAGIPTAGLGAVLVPAPPTSSCEVVCVPSTIGTAAEVSPVAILREGSEVTMLISPALRARVALLDPDLTAGLDTATLRRALIEPWARVVVPAVAASHPHPVQDAVAWALAAVLEDLVNAPIDTQWRQQAALASAQTHTAFVALERPPFSHVLWPVVMEYAAMAEVSKQQALAVLLPPWLRDRGRQDLADRVARTWPGQAVAIDDALRARVRQKWSVFAPEP